MLAGLFSRILRKDRQMAVLVLASVCIIAWTYTALGVGMNMTAIDMTGMASDMAMPATAWTPMNSALMFAMWWVMMVAMMLPSAAPMLLLYQRVVAKRNRDRSLGDMAVFALGYLVAWGGFSLAATGLHAAGELSGWVNGMMASSSDLLNAALLVMAGGWQLTPLKHRCLEACRTPVEFLSRIWRPGARGAFRMGIVHGVFCVGCCWAMMLLLFVGGVMNLYWIGGLALFALAEKLTPGWPLFDRLTGSALFLAGMAVLVLG